MASCLQILIHRPQARQISSLITAFPSCNAIAFMKQMPCVQKDLDDSMRKNAQLTYQESIVDFSDKKNLELFLEDTELVQNNMYLISWCGSESCAETIEQQTKFTMLGFDYQLKHKKKKCLNCSSFGFISVLAKRY